MCQGLKLQFGEGLPSSASLVGRELAWLQTHPAFYSLPRIGNGVSQPVTKQTNLQTVPHSEDCVLCYLSDKKTLQIGCQPIMLAAKLRPEGDLYSHLDRVEWNEQHS